MFYYTAHGLWFAPALNDTFTCRDHLQEPNDEWGERTNGRQVHVSCRLFTEYASDYIEGNLTDAQVQQLDRHLRNCLGCRNYLRQMQLTIQSLRQLKDEPLSPELRNRLLQQFRSWKPKRDN
jgi:hypothetical protein